jgi:hypothetical protein
MPWVKRAGDRRSWAILARNFSVENESEARRKKKVAKKKEKRPVETDAADGNPQRTRIPTAA